MKKNHLNVLEISWCYECYKEQSYTFTNWKKAEEFTQNTANWGKRFLKIRTVRIYWGENEKPICIQIGASKN